MNTTDTLFVIICAAMVLLMTPALAGFYAGLVRAKNSIDIAVRVWLCIAVVGILWILIGFSLAYGSDIGGIIGGMDYIFLNNVGIEPHGTFGTTIPFCVFFLLQTAYAVITPALIAGAVAERMSLKSYIWMIVIWTFIVYIPLVHMIWGGGILSQMGFLDYGGGVVIHASAGFSSLAAAWVLGKRKTDDNTPHNMAQVSINCGLLLFGWLAFNGAGTLQINEGSVYAIVNSLMGIIAGMAVWMVLSKLTNQKVTLINMLLGFLAGLVAVTPGAAYMMPQSALCVAVIVSAVCYIVITYVRPKIQIDDTLDVWAIHGVGGFFGTILNGIYAEPSLIGANYSLIEQLSVQIIGVVLVSAFSFIATWVIMKVIGKVTSLRVDEKTEMNLDQELYGEYMYKNN